MAANVDLLVIVAALADPPLRPRLISIVTGCGWRGGIDVALALDERTSTMVPGGAGRASTRSLGHAVVDVVATTGEGVDEGPA